MFQPHFTGQTNSRIKHWSAAWVITISTHSTLSVYRLDCNCLNRANLDSELIYPWNIWHINTTDSVPILMLLNSSHLHENKKLKEFRRKKSIEDLEKIQKTGIKDFGAKYNKIVFNSKLKKKTKCLSYNKRAREKIEVSSHPPLRQSAIDILGNGDFQSHNQPQCMEF